MLRRNYLWHWTHWLTRSILIDDHRGVVDEVEGGSRGGGGAKSRSKQKDKQDVGIDIDIKLAPRYPRNRPGRELGEEWKRCEVGQSETELQMEGQMADSAMIAEQTQIQLI